MKYEEIVTKLNEYSITHPNIVSLWKHYIHIKRESYHKSIQDCKEEIENFTTRADMNIDTILFLYIFGLVSRE